MWKNYFCQLLNCIDVRQTEMHAAEPLVPEPSSFEEEIAIEKLTSYRSPCFDEILAELIQTGGNILRCEIHKLPQSEINLSLYLFMERALKLAVVIIEGYHCYQLHITFCPMFLGQG
jgi:hypothetical protein